MNYADQKKAAKTNKTMQTIDVAFTQFKDKGDSILGKFLKRTEVESTREGQTYQQYLFDTDAGKVKFHLGRVADGEAGSLMRIGCVYEIVFQGQEAIGGNRRVNIFNISHLVLESDPPVGGDDDIPF